MVKQWLCKNQVSALVNDLVNSSHRALQWFRVSVNGLVSENLVDQLCHFSRINRIPDQMELHVIAASSVGDQRMAVWIALALSSSVMQVWGIGYLNLSQGISW